MRHHFIDIIYETALYMKRLYRCCFETSIQVRHVLEAIRQFYRRVGNCVCAIYTSFYFRRSFRVDQGRLQHAMPYKWWWSRAPAVTSPLMCIAPVFTMPQEGYREYFTSFFNFIDFIKIFALVTIVVLRIMFLYEYAGINLHALDAVKGNATEGSEVDFCWQLPLWWCWW